MLTQFPSGAVRSNDASEERWDLISPIGLKEVARTCAEGAIKYGAFNWEKGLPVSDLLNHAIRHIFLFLSNDKSEPHLPHAAWNILAAIHSLQVWPELNEKFINSLSLREIGGKSPNPSFQEVAEGFLPDNNNLSECHNLKKDSE